MTKLSLHKAGHDPRAASLVALHQVLCQARDSQAALDDALNSPGMMPTDKRLCTELVYGVLRHYLGLQWAVNRYLAKPDKLPLEMRLALVQAFHEMLHLRIPHRASVDWAVNHVRNRFSPGLGRVANGVLRRLQRAIKCFKDFDFYLKECGGPGNEATALGLWYSVPVWVVELWTASYGEEQARAFLEALQRPPLSGLRLNTAADGWEERLARLAGGVAGGLADGVTGGLADGLIDGLIDGMAGQEADAEDNAPRGTKRPLRVGRAGLAFDGVLPWDARQMVKSGLASRQAPASYEALQTLEPGNWREPIWDACAGRGNKTLALLEQGLDVSAASDPSVRRLKNLEPEMERLKITGRNVRILTGPATDVAKDLQAGGHCFGTVLIDAPCSGLGTINRRPEIRLRRSPEDAAALVKTQADILDAAAGCLGPGGQIAYITCTLNPAENEGQVAAFLERVPGAALVSSHQTPPDSPLREFFFSALIRLP